MGWWSTLLNWRSAPGMESSRSSDDQRQFAATSSLTFQLNAPAEITGQAEPSNLDRPVGRAQAVSVPAVKRSRDLIAGTLGTLPIHAHNRARELQDSNLLEQPEPDIAPSVTMTRTVEDMLFEGRSWWRILAFDWRGFPDKVRRLDPRTVQVRQNQKVYVSLDGQLQGSAMEWVPDELLIRVDSPNDPLLVAGARAIRIALLLDKAAARYANEPLPLGFFSPREGVADVGTKEEIEEMLDEWETARQERAWGYVGAALEPHALQWNPEQLQLESQRQHAVLEIARIAGVDPEDLGVSTTSRTYANAEQRRLDLVDFTLAAYVTAIEGRLSMNDVLPRGWHARFQYDGFLRSDTKSRMETYKIGREVGVYDSERIARIEGIPSARPPTQQRQPQQSQLEEETVQQKRDSASVAQFDGDEPAAQLSFRDEDTQLAFTVDKESRTITGLAVPWGKIARSGFSEWKFAQNSLHWSKPGWVKMLRDHDHSQPIGYASKLESTDKGLRTSFKIARGEEGDRALQLAEDGVLDGLSVGIDFVEGDEWQPDPVDEGVRLVNSGTLREVSLTAMPAFDSARVASVAASQKGSNAMPNVAEQTAQADEQDSVTAAAQPDLTEFTAGLSESIKTAVSEAFKNLPQPQREVIPAGQGATVTREAPVYMMNGHGPSLVRDSWKARTEGDHDAVERLRKFQAQTRDTAEDAMHAQFTTADTSNASAVVPPGYRPDLYVTQLMHGRPLLDSSSRGTISDATPFTIPRFTSASGMAGTHTEGTNPTDGTMNIGTVTVTPSAISGLFELTREIIDSANPAIDAIAMQAMQEAYSQQTENVVWTELNGSNGQGGTITNGFVPSGAQVLEVGNATTPAANQRELIQGQRSQLARYAFNRFAAPNRAHLSQNATSAFSSAVGTDERPLLPSVGATNTVGLGSSVDQGWFVDGLPHMATWSMNTADDGDADVLTFNSNDMWTWESPLLMFRFEERGGPARIDLALFGYFATRVLRPVGLSAVRYTGPTN